MTFSASPYAQVLYDPADEHDSCGVAFVVDARGRRAHAIVEAGMTAVRNLEHRLFDYFSPSAAFSTIMPRDCKRVLQAGRMAELSGRDVDDAIMEAARG